MNLLLDTNVIIDYMGGKKPFFDNAQRVVASGYFGDTTLWASAQSFKDAYYVLSHYVDSIRVQEGILKLLEIVHPVHLTGEDITAAARLTWPFLSGSSVPGEWRRPYWGRCRWRKTEIWRTGHPKDVPLAWAEPWTW